MELTFKTRNDKQLLAAEAWLDDSVDEILYGGAKGGGKSFLGASLIFGDALIYPETHYFIARKELNDLRKFTIPTVHEVFKKWDIEIDKYATYNGQDNCFNLHNGSKVFLIACAEQPSDPMFERFGSMQMTRGWIEEGGEVPEAAKANLYLSIGRWKNKEYNLKKKLLITANPKKGWMKRDFVDPFKSGTLPPSRRYIQAFATDNLYLPEDYLNSLRNERDTVRRQRLWEGNWDYDEDKDSLVSFDALTDAFSNTIVLDGQKYMTVDIARLGKDSTAIGIWEGLELYKIIKLQKQATPQTEQYIKDTASAEKIPFSNIIIDEGGVGGGVVDHLYGVKGYNGASVPFPTTTQIKEKNAKIDHFLVPKTTFANLRAQSGWKMAELINERKVHFEVVDYRDEIIEDLTSLLRDREVDGEGRKLLRKKEDIKQELDRSPDVGDMILMRAWFELRGIAGNNSPERVVALNRQQSQFDMNRGRSESTK